MKMKRTIVKFTVLIFVLLGWCLIYILAQQNTPNPDTWITNGPVYAITCSGDVTYVGGHFIYVGKPRGHGVPLDISTGTPISDFPTVNDIVLAAVPDGSGGWYIGGWFTKVGGFERYHLAHILSDFTVDPAWNPNASTNVTALALNGNTLYIGGRFVTIGGKIRRGIAAVDATTGQVTDWNPDANDGVHAFAVSGNTIYVGGYFTSIGGQSRNYIAALDAATGQVIAWNPNANGIVYALAVNGNTVYAGGNFTSIGGQSRNNIAALDAVTGQATPWDPDASYGGGVTNVLVLAVNGNLVYAGGRFSSIGGKNRKYLAAIDAATGQATSWNPNAGNIIHALVVNGNTVYVGGAFSAIGGQNRHYIAAIDTNTGLATSWDPKASNYVYALGVSGNTVYAGGRFSVIGGQKQDYLAAIDTATGQPTAWNPKPSYAVYALTVNGNTVYAGGGFTRVNGQSRNRIAAIDAATGQLTSWNPNANGVVRALAVNGNTVYAGGGFTTIGGQNRNYIAAIDAVTGQVTPWNPNANAMVRAAATNGNTVYVGGNFTFIGGQSRNYIAAIDTATGQVTAWNPNANGRVYALAVSGNTVYVGGAFTTIGGQNRNMIAAIDAVTGQVTAWNPNANGRVYALAVSRNTVYVGGVFSNIGGQFRKYVAAADASTGEITPWKPNLNYMVYSLADSGTALYVGGAFTQVGSDPIEGFARFDGVVSTYVISGTVTDGTNPIPGVTITFSHNNEAATTDPNGEYSCIVTTGTTTTITPASAKYCNWIPPSRTLTNITSNQPGQDFQATPLMLQLTSPNGGENWGRRTVKNINWISSCLSGNVRLFLWKDGVKVGDIAAGIPIQKGTYAWTVGSFSMDMAPAGSGYTVEICTEDGLYCDASDDSFAIVKPSLTLTSPNGGESWKLGVVHNITWTSLGLSGNVSILLLKGGKKLGKIAAQVPVENGSYPWTVGNYASGTVPAGKGYKVKIQLADGHLFDKSHKAFTITSTSTNRNYE